MNKNMVEKIFICIIAILMVILVASKTYATGNFLNDLLDNNGNTYIDPNEPKDDIKEGNTEIKTENENNSETALADEKKTENAPETTPHTGIEDYSIYIFIGIFAVSAVYAYKKVRKYNV